VDSIEYGISGRRVVPDCEITEKIMNGVNAKMISKENKQNNRETNKIHIDIVIERQDDCHRFDFQEDFWLAKTRATRDKQDYIQIFVSECQLCRSSRNVSEKRSLTARRVLSVKELKRCADSLRDHADAIDQIIAKKSLKRKL